MKPLALAVPVVLLLSSCAAYNAQHGRLEQQSAKAPEGAPEARTTPSAATPSGATSSAATPAPAPSNDPLTLQQTLLVAQIDQFREELKANGKYDCCVKPACRQCAMTAGECHCREVISANGPCCGECTQSWVDGKGNTEGVDREQVLAHLGCLRELYDKKVPEGITPPGEKKPD